MKTSILFLLICFTMTGCIKEVEWPLDGNVNNILIADALITDEVRPQTVKLSFPVAELNQESVPATGAVVIISNEDSTWQFAEQPSHPGTYTSTGNMSALPDKNYTLLVSYGGKVYSAKATMLQGSLFKELQYVKNSGNDLYHIDWVASAYSAENAAMWEILLDWSMVPGYENADSSETRARMLFYTLPTLDVSEIFAPVMEQVSFPSGTNITERRYSLTAGHAEFAREMLLETNWTGGFFNVASANVITNLSGGARGYFGICAVTELSITVK